MARKSLKEKFNQIRKIDFEELVEDHSRDMMGGQGRITSSQLLSISLIWILVGVVIVNLEIKAIAWISPLGWVVMLVGSISLMVAKGLAHAITHKFPPR